VVAGGRYGGLGRCIAGDHPGQAVEQDWWVPVWFIGMALIPAGPMAVGLIGRSPRRLVAAPATMAVWATVLGVLGMVSLIGLPLILEGALTSQLIPACADGQHGRPNQS
jgi:hypothetical protein